MKCKLFFLLLLFSFELSAQDVAFSISVNFRKNKSELSKTEIKKIDEALNSFKAQGSYSIIIKGFTDSDSDSLYNYKLSERRCETVAGYLTQNGINSSLIKLIPLGEEFSLPENAREEIKSKNRRVDIIVLVDAKEEPVKDIEKPKSNCDHDTTILLDDGVLTVMKVCEYKKKKDCIVIRSRKEVQYVMKLSRFRMKLGLKHFYKVKKKITTYRVGYYCKDTACGKTWISLMLPLVQIDAKDYVVKKYDSASSSYQLYKESKVKSVKKKKYICLSKVDCARYSGSSGGYDNYIINCGGSLAVCNCKKSKLKFKNGLKVIIPEHKEFAGDDDLIPQEIKKTLLLNPSEYMGSLKLLSRNNDTISLNTSIEIGALKHGLFRSKSCEKKWFLFMKIHKRCDTYRRYKFKFKDIELQERKPWSNSDN